MVAECATSGTTIRSLLRTTAQALVAKVARKCGAFLWVGTAAGAAARKVVAAVLLLLLLLLLLSWLLLPALPGLLALKLQPLMGPTPLTQCRRLAVTQRAPYPPAERRSVSVSADE